MPIFKQQFDFFEFILKKNVTANTLGGKMKGVGILFLFHLKHKLIKTFQTHSHTVTCMLTPS